MRLDLGVSSMARTQWRLFNLFDIRMSQTQRESSKSDDVRDDRARDGKMASRHEAHEHGTKWHQMAQ